MCVCIYVHASVSACMHVQSLSHVWICAKEVTDWSCMMGEDTMWYFFYDYFSGVTWRHFITDITDPRKTAQERCKMLKDSNCTNKTKWEIREVQREWRMKTGREERMGTWQGNRKWYRRGLLLMPVHQSMNLKNNPQWCCSAYVIHLSCVLFTKDMNIHWKAICTLHTVSNNISILLICNSLTV